MSPTDQTTHVVHLLYRFAAGGLENVIVQLINGLPRQRYRHTIVALHKPPGQPFKLYPRHGLYTVLEQYEALLTE